MSVLTHTLAERRVERVEWTDTDVAEITGVTGCTVTIDTLRRGQRAMIVGVDQALEPAWCRRMIDLGFAPGATVEFIRRAPLGDPRVFRVADYEVALRRPLSRSIRVQLLP